MLQERSQQESENGIKLGTVSEFCVLSEPARPYHNGIQMRLNFHHGEVSGIAINCLGDTSEQALGVVQ